MVDFTGRPDRDVPSAVQEQELSVRAKCMIRVGDICTIFFPLNDLTLSTKPEVYEDCQGKEAAIVSFVGGLVVLRMQHGLQRVVKLPPAFLDFSRHGLFVRRKSTEEHS